MTNQRSTLHPLRAMSSSQPTPAVESTVSPVGRSSHESHTSLPDAVQKPTDTVDDEFITGKPLYLVLLGILLSIFLFVMHPDPSSGTCTKKCLFQDCNRSNHRRECPTLYRIDIQRADPVDLDPHLLFAHPSILPTDIWPTNSTIPVEMGG